MERGTEKCSNTQPTGLSAVREERDNCLFSNFTRLEPRLSIFTIQGSVCLLICFSAYVRTKIGYSTRTGGFDQLCGPRFLGLELDINQLVLGFDFIYTKVRVCVSVCVQHCLPAWRNGIVFHSQITINNQFCQQRCHKPASEILLRALFAFVSSMTGAPTVIWFPSNKSIKFTFNI